MESWPIQQVPLGPEAEFPFGQLRKPSAEGHTVAELLPAGYGRYVRIFHPFFMAGVTKPQEAGGAEMRTWQSLAQEAGVVFHPEIVWESLLPALPEGSKEGVREWWVSEGRLDDPALSAIFGLLAEHSAEQEAYFLYSLSRIVLGREPLLFRARIEAVQEVRTAAEADLDPAWRQGPEFVWPLDRMWVVNTDIDLDSTYVACNRALADAILSDPILEAIDVGLDTRVDHRADRVNRPHERSPFV